mgnify:CR=1 FL=1
MFLAQNERPDFRTISDFRKRHRAELAELLTQTIAIGVREKLIDLKCVAIDGTKIHASAGTKSFKNPEFLKEELKRLEAEIQESLEKDIRNDDDEDEQHGGGDGEIRLTSAGEDKKVLRDKLKKALDHYQSLEGEKPKGVSITDPECRYMQGKGINPSYNAQLAVDSKCLMAVGGYITTACCDSSQLVPVVEDVKERTGKDPEVVVADRGYSNLGSIAEIEKKQILAYVSLINYKKHRPHTGFAYNSESNTFTCPEGRSLRQSQEYPPGRALRYRSVSCKGCSRVSSCMPGRSDSSHRTITVTAFQESVERVRARLETPIGLAMRKLRSATVEPVFGVIKHALRFRRVSVRGSPMVDAEWKFQLAIYNIFKLTRYARGDFQLTPA